MSQMYSAASAASQKMARNGARIGRLTRDRAVGIFRREVTRGRGRNFRKTEPDRPSDLAVHLAPRDLEPRNTR